MSHGFARLSLAAGLLALLAITSVASQRATPSAATQWFKGNTHTHTVNSDGDSTPDEVVRWYREHEYQFLVLTDHNYLTGVDGLNALHGAIDKFLVIRGEEVTTRLGNKPLHINGLNLREYVEPPAAASVVEILQRAVDDIRRAGGVPNINHPNFGWAITHDELRAVERTKLFEVYNGHPHVNNAGGGDAPGLEEVWDRILTSGRLLYGLAVDDAHYFKRPGDDSVPGPGRGWVFVRAAALDARAIVEALERGDFYSSTGVELSRYDATDRDVRLEVRAVPSSRYRIQFVGSGGRILSEQSGPAASYTFKGTEGYVRARVLESNGRLAWAQPIAVGPGAPK